MKRICSLLLVLCCICLALNVTAQLPSYVPTNGLVGWWGFTGNANDYSGTGNHGSITGGVTPTTDRLGSPNKAYYFDGTGFVTLSSCPTAGSSDFTISVWLVSPDSTYDRNPILNYGTLTTENQIMMQIQMPIGFVRVNLCGRVGPGSSITVNDNEWHMATLRNSMGIFQIYVDGDTSGIPVTMYPNIIPCEQKDIGRIIKLGYTDTLYYTGKLDDIGIWNRALSQGEITALFTGVGSFVEDAVLLTPVSVYPNPASTRLNITLPNKSSEQTNVALYTINGQLVMQSSQWNLSTIDLDVETVPEGLYFLRIESGQGTATKKVVIQRD